MTPKQERFVLEYLVDLNATRAAIRAGYSPETARSMGSENLSKPDIADAIVAEQTKRRERLELSGDQVLREYARIAFANMSDFVIVGSDGVTVRPMDDLTEDQMAAIAEVTVTPTQNGATVKLKLHDKLRALDALSKHLGLFAPEKVAMTNAAGEDVKPTDPVELARGLAFLLAKGAAEQGHAEEASSRLQ